MRVQRKPVWRKSIVGLAIKGLLGASIVPCVAIGQTVAPGVPSSPTSNIVNNVTMRAATVAPLSLFNGTSLAGWVGDSTWSIQDGAITGGSGGSLGASRYLVSTGIYKNFELNLKVKAPPTGDLNNGGVEFLNTTFTDSRGVVRKVAYQWDAGSGYWGTLYDEGTRFRTVRSAPVSPPKDGSDPHVTGYPAWAAPVVKLSDWNDLRLVVEYPRIRGWVNGVLAIDFTETEPEIAKAVKTAIAANAAQPLMLQAHAGSSVKVQYKDIVLTQLVDQEQLPLGNLNFAKVGRWLPPQDIGLIAVNAHLLPNGKVLMHDASQDDNLMPNNGTWMDKPNGTPRPSLVALWDPIPNTLANLDQWFISQAQLELFCSGHTFLPNGDLVFQGNTQNSQVSASAWKATLLYNWRTNTWSRGNDSTRAAYYPTLTSTGSGDVLSFASGDANGKDRPVGDHTEVYNYQTGSWRRLTNDAEWSSLTSYLGANLSLVSNSDPYYNVAMMPGTGKVLHLGGPAHLVAADYAGNGGAQYYSKREGIVRHWGSHQIYGRGKILYAGGGSYNYRYGSTNNSWDGASVVQNSAVTIDMNNGWQRAPMVARTGDMQEGRVRTSSSLMADGKVIMTGGHDWTVGPFWKDTAIEPEYSWSIAKLRPEVWDPATGQWSEMQPQQRRRQYHGVTVLLPDGRIMSGGSGMPEMYKAFGGYGGNGNAYPIWNDHSIEIFEPGYLFDAAGNYAVRPSIAWAPASVGYQQNFSIYVGASTTIQKLHLIKLSSQTHGVEMSSRLVPLEFTQNGGQLNVTGIGDSTLAPAGHYMLFAVDNNGVPSISKMIKVDGYLSVHVVSQPTGKALSQKDTALAAGATVGTADLSPGNLAQSWQMQFGEWTDGAYRLVSRRTGMALDYSVQTSFQGFPVLNQRKPTPESIAVKKQSFKIASVGNREYKLETEGRTLDGYWQTSLNGGTTRDEIVSYPYDGRNNQRWYIFPTNAPVTIRLGTSGGALGSNLSNMGPEGANWFVKPVLTGSGKVNIAVDAAGLVLLGLNSSGLLAALPANGNTATTEWEIEYLPKGLMRLVHTQTKKVLTAVEDGYLGRVVIGMQSTTDPYQYWRMTN